MGWRDQKDGGGEGSDAHRLVTGHHWPPRSPFHGVGGLAGGPGQETEREMPCKSRLTQGASGLITSRVRNKHLKGGPNNLMPVVFSPGLQTTARGPNLAWCLLL